jgi:hypothetical protein
MFLSWKPTSRKSPCKDCKDRYPGCHGSCEAYQLYKDLRSKANKKRYFESDVNDLEHCRRLRAKRKWCGK